MLRYLIADKLNWEQLKISFLNMFLVLFTHVNIQTHIIQMQEVSFFSIVYKPYCILSCMHVLLKHCSMIRSLHSPFPLPPQPILHKFFHFSLFRLGFIIPPPPSTNLT